MKYSYLLTTFRCLSDILITSCWLFKLQLDQAQTSRKTGLRIKEQKKEVDSFTGGTQTRAARARESSVTHKSAITNHAVKENHVSNWYKAKVVDREAQRQTRWIKRGTLDQEDSDMHESGRRILQTQPHMGPGDFQITCVNKMWSRCPTSLMTLSLGNLTILSCVE